MDTNTSEEKGKNAAKFLKSFLFELFKPIFSILFFSKGKKKFFPIFLNILLVFFLLYLVLAFVAFMNSN